MAKKELTYTIRVNGVRVTSLTEEQKDKICERFASALNEYYAQHPEEYEKL